MSGQPSKQDGGLVWRKSDGRCWYCGVVLTVGVFAIDHLVPRSAGGSNAPNNLVPACWSCNSRKGGRALARMRYLLGKPPDAPLFTDEQLDYLESCGLDLREGAPHTFYFEQTGLTP